jgi:DNA-directed RNA polymerase subunit RPC12/RpoP
MTQKGFVSKSIRENEEVQKIFGPQEKPQAQETPVTNLGAPKMKKHEELRERVCPKCGKTFSYVRKYGFGNIRKYCFECHPTKGEYRAFFCLNCGKELSKPLNLHTWHKNFCCEDCRFKFQFLPLDERLKRFSVRKGAWKNEAK